jgi:hypothetical protein
MERIQPITAAPVDRTVPGVERTVLTPLEREAERERRERERRKRRERAPKRPEGRDGGVDLRC